MLTAIGMFAQRRMDRRLSPEVHERVSRGARNVTVPQNPSIGCRCGSWLAVNAQGDVSPCGILLDEVSCGNVREKSFQEIIDHSPAVQQVLDRNLLKGKRYAFMVRHARRPTPPG